MPGQPQVSVIMVNWNGAEHLRLCLPTLVSQSTKPLEIIIVDNHSSDDSAEVARSFQVRWLPLNENLGLAPALNRGAAIARGDLLLFVNNDMRFDPEFVAALAAPLPQDEECFATDGMQFNWEGTIRVHLAARLRDGRTRQDTLAELVPGLSFYQQEEDQKTPVFMASAACMMVRRTHFEQLDGFDNRLPLGYEDVEICWRAWARGWKTVYVPSAICWHRLGASGKSQEGARFNFRGILRGRMLVATKLLPSRYIFRTWLVSGAGLLKDLGQLRWRFAKDRVKGLIQMAGLAPQLLRERKVIFRNAGRSPAEHLDFLLQLTAKEPRA
ncbi:MAG TPA: glycosyltransferase family 2 protein [Candidatus Acidoferrales bacterium]|jgi:GT2 family glycosyltransferase|nr:glycosyltransferase family 2 protein [Candidatus Acidoferrales bacterium]